MCVEEEGVLDGDLQRLHNLSQHARADSRIEGRYLWFGRLCSGVLVVVVFSSMLRIRS
jgi:hypothetical protein